jgi:hypothetical protein
MIGPMIGDGGGGTVGQQQMNDVLFEKLIRDTLCDKTLSISPASRFRKGAIPERFNCKPGKSGW